MKKKILFPILLLSLAVPLCFSKNSSGVSAEMIGDYSSQSEYTKAGSALNAEIANEGFVLLKNDGFLPFTKENGKMTVVGKSSINLVKGGGGSGSGRVNGETEIDLEKSLKDVGITINPKTTEFYKSSSKSGSGRTNGNDGWKGNSEVTIGETPIAKVTGESGLVDSFANYPDAAIMTISREGSEGCDVKTCNAHDSIKTNASAEKVSDRHALQLSENEEALFNLICEKFDHVIILINSGNIFQCDKFENNPKVSAILWMGNPGAVGTGAVGRILTGKVNPSGRTVDTWARDFTKDPTYQNFSDNSQTNLVTSASGKQYYAPKETMFASDGAPMLSYGTDKNYSKHSAPRWDNARGGEEFKVVSGGLNGVKPASYVSYEEGIYVDYRYYETRYADMAAADKAAADAWYASEDGVIYPFGYGLSYTSFSQEIVSSNIAGKSLTKDNTKIEVQVKVKNTGAVAGKEVVQLYWKAPYTAGGIEKADHVLCAFDKTKLLEPNEEQVLTLKLNAQDFANYDFADKNGNQFCGYEMDPGSYQILLGKNAHESLGKVEFSVGAGGIQFDKDRYTLNEVKNRFTNRGFYDCLPGEKDIGFEQFSRVDLSAKPHSPTIAERTVKEGSRYEEFLTHEFTMKDTTDGKGEYIPLEAVKTKEDIDKLGWTQVTKAPAKADSVKFKDLMNLRMDDPLWEDAMDQLTYAELTSFGYGGGNHNPEISRMGKPGTGDSDGPSQFKYIWWCGAPIVAATYNVDLARRQGEMVGMEGKISGTYGWAGPAVNLHRSPFGGRNFEYYSADPFLMGRMAGRVVAGATDTGVYCFFKHFAVNDQEKNREGTSTFLTEQALREIYLKPFQMVVQEGKSTGIMSSYNRLGNMETAASYPLLTEVLRQEWGFKGHIISDMTHSGNSSVNFKCYENVNNRILAGCNQQLDSNGFKSNIECKWTSSAYDGKGCPTFTVDGQKVESYTFWYALRNNAKETMWTCARCGAMISKFLKSANLKFVEAERNYYEGEMNKALEINVELPAELAVGQTYSGKKIASVELSIDPFTPLPDGLTFANNKISGTPTEGFNGFVHVLAKITFEGDTKTTLGSSLELNVPGQPKKQGRQVTPEPEPEPEPAPKKGCGGAVEATMSLLGLLTVAGIVILVIDKKRKVRA